MSNKESESKNKNNILEFNNQEYINKTVLSESDINNLFFGFIKLIKKSVIIEKEKYYKAELSYYTKQVELYSQELAKKNKTIKQLNDKLNKLNQTKPKVSNGA